MWTTKIKRSEIEKRMDVRYYHPKYIRMMAMLKKIPFPIKELKEISYPIVSGATPRAKGEAYTSKDKGIPFIRSGDITDENTIFYDSVLYIKREVHESMLARSKLCKGDILVAIVGATIGKVSLFLDDRNANINQALALVRTKNNVNRNYVRYFLGSKYGQFQLDRLKRPVARANINCKEVGLIKIPIPPAEVQNKIARLMQNACKEKQDKFNESEKLLNAIDSLISEEFGIDFLGIREWKTFSISHSELSGRLDVFYYNPRYTMVLNKLENTKTSSQVKTIEELGKVKCGPFGSSIKSEDYKEDGVPLIRIGNLNEGTVVETEETPLVFISEELSNELESTQVFPDDIVISQRGTIGNISKVPSTYRVWNISANLIAIKEIETVNPDYVRIFLNSPFGQLQLKRFSSGHVQAKITTNDLRLVKILIPSKEVQNKIAERAKRIREEAQRLRIEAEEVIRNAEQEVERIILKGL